MSTKSCLDCPSLLDQEEAQVFFGVAQAMPMCSRYGHVFGEIGSDAVLVDAATSRAGGCSSFGNAKAITPPATLGVGLYEPRSDLLEVKSGNVSSCMDCLNFDEKRNACAATGRIIFPERRTQEAQNCGWSEERLIGTVPNLTKEILPSFGTETQVFIRNAPTAAPKKSAPPKKKATPRHKMIAPFDYSSDAKVTDEHEKRGIRAWRKHETERSKVYYLPIFRSDYFGERASLIPSAESEHGDPTLYIDHSNLMTEFAVQVYQKDFNLVVVGEPGSGKTEGVRWLAYTMNMPFERLPYTEDSESDQFLGMYQFDPTRGTYLDPGLLPEAWVLPGVLLSDEPNLAPEPIMQAYRSMNDSSRQLTVYKEKYMRHDYCFHIMAINPHWDFRNIGTKPLASADSRRLSFHWMPNPDASMAKEIISSTIKKLDGKAPERKLVTLIVKISQDLNEMSQQGTLPDFWTLSQDIKVARLVEDFGLEGAYRRAYFNYIDPQDAEPAMAAIKGHVPYGSEWA